jgi:hypothetical protein
VCSVLCSLLLTSLPLWQWQVLVYIPGPGSKQSHVIISPTRSLHSSTRRRREAARRRELATCHARARFLSGGAVSSEAVHHLRFPSSPPSRISPLFLRPSSLRPRPRPRGPFPRLRSHRGVSSGGLLGKGERTSMRKRKNRKTNMR